MLLPGRQRQNEVNCASVAASLGGWRKSPTHTHTHTHTLSEPLMSNLLISIPSTKYYSPMLGGMEEIPYIHICAYTHMNWVSEPLMTNSLACNHTFHKIV